jgi:hypothetical protein
MTLHRSARQACTVIKRVATWGAGSEEADDSAGGSEQADVGVSRAWQRRKRIRSDNLDTGHDPGEGDL